MTPAVVALFPELTDVNGDAQNALVLQRRAEWAGEDAQVVPVALGAAPAVDPVAVVLGSRVDLGDGGIVEGIGLLPGSTLPLEIRVTDDLVVDAAEGRLVGYENHSRGFRLDPGVPALGRVVHGIGDGRGVDGVRHGSVLGTRMHGPVLAKNPALADAVLARAFGRRVVPTAEQARVADVAAAAIRTRLLNRIALR